VGRYTVLGWTGRDCFEKQTPKKGLFISINRMFWGCFSDGSEVGAVSDGPKGPEVPKEPEVEDARE
jgi:hypothetical protein